MSILWVALLSVSMAAELSGQVVDEAGAPIEGIYVLAYDSQLLYADAESEFYDISDADGRWSIDVPDEAFRVRYIPGQAVNRTETWQGEGQVCDGDLVQAGDSPLHAQMEPGGEIWGRVVDVDGEPVAGVQLSTLAALGRATTYPRQAITDIAGQFELIGLPSPGGSSGQWIIEAAPDDRPVQFLGSEPFYLTYEAERHELAAGDVLDLGDVPLLDGIAVSGIVVGPTGEAVVDGSVHVYSESQVASSSLDDGGGWSVRGIPPGPTVLNWLWADGYAVTYYPDSDRPGERVALDQEGGVYDGVLDLYPPEEGRLVGRLVAEGNLDSVGIAAYNDDGSVGVGGTVDADGTFVISRLHGGDYTVLVNAASEGFLNSYALDDQGERRVFQVPTAADSAFAIIDLEPGAEVEGVVRDAVTGEPVYGALVFAEWHPPGDDTPRRSAVITERDGAYHLAGLPEIEAQLWVEHDPACVGDPTYVSIWYEAEPYWVDGLPVQLVAGEVLSWSPDLPPDADSDEMDDAWEQAYGLDITRDDREEDPDCDGIINYSEYIFHTDPTDGDCDAKACGCSAASSGMGGVGGLGLMGLLLLVRRRRTMAWTP